jgi:F-type H+-transporting ATPase subunit a
VKEKKWYTKWYNIVIPALILSLICFGFFISSSNLGATVPLDENAEQPFVSISGTRVLLKVDLRTLFGAEEQPLSAPDAMISPLHEFTLTDTQVNSFLVVAIIGLLCFWLTRDLSVVPQSKRQILAEFLVEKTQGLIKDSMSSDFVAGFSPFIAALMGLSALSSLTSLLGWYPPTADVNTIIGWSIVVFVLIMYQKLRPGLWSYLKGLTEPVFVMAPMNVLGEVSTPLSMTFRHFGNVFSGVVISALLTAATTFASNLIWNLLGVGGWISEFAFFRIGIPAIFSIYFDIFSGCLQAFIFCTLTMLNIYLAYESSNETIAEKREKKAAKAAKKAEKAAKKAAKDPA